MVGPVLPLAGPVAIEGEVTAGTPHDLLPLLPVTQRTRSQPPARLAPQPLPLRPERSPHLLTNDPLEGGGSLVSRGVAGVVPDPRVGATLQEKQDKVSTVGEYADVQRSPAEPQQNILILNLQNYIKFTWTER